MNKEGLWGKIYPTADFPVREKKKVNVFKLKEYVDSKLLEVEDDSENQGSVCTVLGSTELFNFRCSDHGGQLSGLSSGL
jgi:hypothetical protein